jgi:peptide/nickel transport system ATP-binding protein
MNLLEVNNLSIGYRTGNGIFTAVDSVSFSLDRGKSLGFVGESGCGKTTIGMALLDILPENAAVLGGEVLFEGQDLTKLNPDAMRNIRWKKIAMIFQAAMNALNPVQRVNEQIAEALLTHDAGLSRPEALEQVQKLFDIVGIPLKRMGDYPHQYSGGMKQRAIIAMALACRPALIIADEPTTALDVIVQDQILKAIRGLQEEMNIAMIFISHDIAVVADVCHHIAVMFDGRIVEYGRREEVFEHPAHPYTKILLASHLSLMGSTPPPSDLVISDDGIAAAIESNGCSFCPRCPRQEPSCRIDGQEWVGLTPTHSVLCRRGEEKA